MASTPWVRLPNSSWETDVRHEPNASRSGRPASSVAITGAGNGEDGSGQTGCPSMATE